MSFILAVLLAGSAAPPPDDDDGPRRKAAATHRPRVHSHEHDDDDDDDRKAKPKSAIVPAPALPGVPAPGPAAAVEPGDQPALKPPLVAGHVDPPVATREPDRDHDDDDDDEGTVQPATAIVVTARKLDAARTQIDAGLGASVYSLTNDAIENRPGGETGSVADILSQAPGVTLSGTSLTVRGSPANQVRINDVIVPEAVSDPADLISSRLAQTTRLITGTLPSQFGFAPAGVISITTKNGLYQHGGELELFGGSNGMVEPAFEWAGSAAGTSLFGSGELERDQSTIADRDGNMAQVRRTAVDGLGFADHVIDGENRVSFLFGGSHEHQRFGETNIGRGSQDEDAGYGVATYQHSAGGLTVQASVFAGVATDAARFTNATRERRSSWGTQIDASDDIGGGHLLRFGLLSTRSTTRELELDGDRSQAERTSAAVYAQDEWKLASALTFNPGIRVEWLRRLASPAYIEPRASVVWQPGSGFSGHVGYARYASTPPLGDHNGAQVPDERDNYMDAGFQRTWGALTVGVDGYVRSAADYLTELQSPGSALSTTFAFERARIRGVELSATYARRGTTAWANVALSRATGRTIVGGKSLFAAASLSAASATYLPLATDRPLAASGGVTERLGKFSLGADVLASSGSVRTTKLTQLDRGRHSAYAVLGLSAVYHTAIGGREADLRLDVTNLMDANYVTSDASSVVGGWTRFGRHRAVTVGIEQSL